MCIVSLSLNGDATPFLTLLPRVARGSVAVLNRKSPGRWMPGLLPSSRGERVMAGKLSPLSDYHPDRINQPVQAEAPAREKTGASRVPLGGTWVPSRRNHVMARESHHCQSKYHSRMMVPGTTISFLSLRRACSYAGRECRDPKHRYFFWALARGRQQSSGERLDRSA
jgi:hypothetical protein